MFPKLGLNGLTISEYLSKMIFEFHFHISFHHNEYKCFDRYTTVTSSYDRLLSVVTLGYVLCVVAHRLTLM